MEYISHEGYKDMLKGFAKGAPKQTLNEGLEKEGNAFTAGLAKAKKGEEFKVDNKSVKDTSNYDAPIKEDGVEEGKAEIIDRIRPNLYRIKSPTGKVSDVRFQENLEDVIDPPYTWSGWLDGSDGEFDYSIDCEFVAIGGGDYDWYPDAESLTAYKTQGTVDEYRFDDKYPDDPGPFEGMRYMDPDSEDFSMAVAEDIEGGDWGLTPEQVQAALDYAEEHYYDLQGDFANTHDIGGGSHEAAKQVVDLIKKQSGGMGEGINLPSTQATGQTIVANETKRDLSKLAPEEKDQLKQYIESIKTIKEEIKKMVNKTGMKEGGDMTNLVMKPTTMSEDNEEHETMENSLGEKLHTAFYKVTDMAIKQLVADGWEPSQAASFLKVEIEERAKEATNAQYDL